MLFRFILFYIYFLVMAGGGSILRFFKIIGLDIFSRDKKMLFLMNIIERFLF